MYFRYILGLFFLVSHIGCALGEYCYSSSVFYLECPYGCCGTSYNQYCCANVGAIVGGVIGALIFVGVVIAIISCLCCACCQSTRQRFSGTVFQTNPNHTTTVAVQQPGYGQPYVMQSNGFQSVQTQYPAGNIVYMQDDSKAGYPNGAVTYQGAQAPPVYTS